MHAWNLVEVHRIPVKRSEAKLIYDRQSIDQSVLVLGSHLGPMTRYLFAVWQLRVSCYGATSLTRGWVCNLLVQLFLGLARAVTLESESRRTHGHILLSQTRLPHPGGPSPRIYIPEEQGGPVIPPGTGFHFLCLCGERCRCTKVPGQALCVTGIGSRWDMRWRSCCRKWAVSIGCEVEVRNSPGILNGSP
jgi:hypothetical protein